MTIKGFTPGEFDPERTDTYEYQKKKELESKRSAEEEFREAQSGLNLAGEALYNFGKAVLFITTGGSIQSTQALDALRAKIEGKSFIPPSPNPNAPGIDNVQPTIPNISTEEQSIIEDVPQYPVVLQRILKVRKDNPGFFSNIINSIGKNNTEEDIRGGATDAQINQAYKEITDAKGLNTSLEDRLKSGGAGINPITGQPLQFAQTTPPTFTQKGLFTKTQMKQYTTNRPPGMKLAAYNALRDNGMLSDVIPLDQSLDITEFSRGYISALTNPEFAIGDFARTKNEAIAAFSDKYYQLTRSVARPDFLAPELDHTTPLKVTGAILFPGSSRREIRALIDILYDNGLYAGDDPLNLRMLPGEVHQIATNWVTLNLGRQGQKFLDEISTLELPRTAPTKKYPNGVYTFRAKQEIALLYANQVKKMKEQVQEAYELFDLLYDFRTPGLAGLDQNKLEKFVNVLERIDVDSPLTIKTIRDIAEGAAQGTPYIFANLQETIEQLQQARGAANEAMEQLFDNTLTPTQRETANRNFDKFTNLANELQETLGKIMKGTIEEG
tara:strand:- start:42 stop:1706 length:1665 start_codon:yes stop_codon:yes gene_type:complete